MTDQERDLGATQLVSALRRMARRMGAVFVVDPEKRRAYEHARGFKAAEQLIAEGDSAVIFRNYGYSKANPEQDDFDRGYQRAIKAWMAGLK